MTVLDVATPSPQVAAQHRAMPYTRLTDCGMDPADARALLAATAAGADWEHVAADLARSQHERSVRAEGAGHRQTALEAARAATAARCFAQMARNSDDDVKRAGYRSYVDALRRTAQLSDPVVERWELPHRGGHLVGWLCLPPAGRAAATVVVWGGLSGWGGAYLSVADALTRRGLACVLAEGPGQGESRLEGRCYVDEAVTEGFARFLDAVTEDPRLGGRVGIQGNSFGGLFAAQLAATDDRVAACVVNGAPSRPEVPDFRSAREQMSAAVGSTDLARVAQVVAALAFDGSQRPVRTPLLVLHGGRDPLVTQVEQERFLDGADPATSRLAVWPDGEHTLYGHAAERDALTADWFTEQLLRGAVSPADSKL